MWTRVTQVLMAAVLGLLAVLPAGGAIQIPRAAAEVRIDGRLDEDAWQTAVSVESFYEYYRGDNDQPPARTEALLTYDATAIYVAFRAHDPNPLRIRAPLVDRDSIDSDQDWVGIVLDTQNDRKSSLVFRVNPRGVLSDAIRSDTGGGEDTAPDFFFDAKARIDELGWVAEIRIPLSSLRYANAEHQSWGVILQRNYPRDFRYLMASTRIPKASNCFVCHAEEMTGLEKLPTAQHVTIAPYVTGSMAQTRAIPGDFDSSLETGDPAGELGLDAKWIPSPALALDLTLNPDFSQIESDVPQLDVNSRFALSFPEKRPFFLEGSDLLSTQLNAVYTRSITAPSWGAKATGQLGNTSYTTLISEDRGGGVVILPGAFGSEAASQDFSSLALIGRVRHSIGRNHAGMLLSSREVDRGGYNRVVGPDFEWNPNDRNKLRVQYLRSWTENPDRPDLSSRFDGSSSQSHALQFNWNRSGPFGQWVFFREIGEGFRADNGFMPQVNLRSFEAGVWGDIYPEGRGVSYVNPWGGWKRAETMSGELIRQSPFAGIYFEGKWNSNGWLTLEPVREERVDGELLQFSMIDCGLRVRPFSWLPYFFLSGTGGERVDYAHARVGKGADLRLETTFRPTDHLEVSLNGQYSWLDLDEPDASGRLFTATVERLKATYMITSRSLVRVIAQHSDVHRDPSLYSATVDDRDGSTSLSALLGYRLNWQTVFFVGYGDNQSLDRLDNFETTSRSLFTKISYAWQR